MEIEGLTRENKVQKILYVRSGPYQVNPTSYNLQEVGLATAFAKKGIQCDIMYYHKTRNFNQTISKGSEQVTIFWRKGLKLCRSGIYPKILKKDFLAQYDAIIISEYSQIMSVLLSLKHPNVYIYNGPYYNLFKIPYIEPIYDRLFIPFLNKHVKMIFSKTKRAESYLNHKGLTKTKVTGVGLDFDKMDNHINDKTQILLDKMADHQNLLYIGSIDKRKNTAFLFQVFKQLKQEDKYKHLQLVLVGKGKKAYIDYCKSLVDDTILADIILVERIENAQTHFVYEKCDVFLLPSLQEIFGMVLLEAMFSKCSIISSNSAGAETLLSDSKAGIIMEKFDVQAWAQQIINLLDNPGLRKELGDKAHQTIIEDFNWDIIAHKMIEGITIND